MIKSLQLRPADVYHPLVGPHLAFTSTGLVPPRLGDSRGGNKKYNQMDSFVYLGGTVSETPDVSADISRWTRACWMCVKKYAVQLYDRPTVLLDLKVRIVKAEAVEALLYGSVIWT